MTTEHGDDLFAHTDMIGDRDTVCIGVPGSLVGVVLTVPGSEYA